MKILIIGCGSIGERHARNSKQYGDTAVVDENISLARDCAQKLDVRFMNNLEAGLAWKPQGVIVATPTHTHIGVARQAIEAGADVLIEKPLSHTVTGLDDFLQRAASLNRRVFVVCNMRFHPAVKTLHQNLQRIGRPLFARAHVGNYLPNMRPNADYRKLYCANRNQGGGVLLDAIHEIDYLMWFFGPVEKTTCAGAKLSDLEIDVEDYACICLRHAGNTISEIQMDYLRPYKRRGCEIVGEAGILLWESEGKLPETVRVRLFLTETNSWQTLYASEDLDTNHPYQELIRHFTQALQGEDAPLLTGRDAAAELDVIRSARQQIEPLPFA